MGVLWLADCPRKPDENPPVMENEIGGILLVIVLIVLKIAQELGWLPDDNGE